MAAEMLIWGSLAAAAVLATWAWFLTPDRCMGCGKEFGADDTVNFDGLLRQYCDRCWAQRHREDT